MVSKHLKTFLVILAFVSFASSVAFAQETRTDQSLDSSYYFKMSGLDGRGGVCADTGEVGVSRFITSDKALLMAGSVQPTYDDARTSDCARVVQTYTVVNRDSNATPGLTNTVIGLKIPSMCSTEDECSWSTMYAGPLLPDRAFDDISDLETLTEHEKDAIGIIFPDTIGGHMFWHALAPSTDSIQARYMTWLKTKDPTDEDIITVTQYVYKPDNDSYFDITWKIETQRRTFTNEVKFFHGVDTFTGGNDFGYGYLCDVCKIAGGTGGSAFFQGTIALHPSDKQFEGFWGAVFQLLKLDNLPDFTWSQPLRPSTADPSKKVVPLTTLEDNAIAQEWDDLTISPTPTYISVRWTFDDPILNSNYGTPRSMFVVSSNDGTFDDETAGETEIEPRLFDIRYDSRSWRGKVIGARMPKTCETNADCDVSGVTESCLTTPECSGEANCPKYCAAGLATSGCGSGQEELFGFCMDTGSRWYWATKSLENTTTSDRNIFTFEPTTGTRYWFDTGNAATLNAQFGYADTASAANLIRWTVGSLYNTSDELIIDSNETHDFDLHKPLKEIASGDVVELLRERYDSTANNSWLLGDIAHAEPVFIGSRPSNGWTDVGGEHYSTWVNKEEYMRRKPILLVAANDGMLHAYDSETGDELWAFVPWDVLPKLKEVAKPFYEQLRFPLMDLTPVVHDAWDGSNWRTILMVGSRGGGTRYWAMDITPKMGHLTPGERLVDTPLPAAQSRLKFLWTFTDADLGMTYSIPTSGRFKTGNAVGSNPPPDKWLVFLGSGYAEHSAAQMQKQGYFYALEMFPSAGAVTPTVLAKIKIDGGVNGVDGIGADEVGKLYNNALSSPTVGDKDGDGYEDVVYVGDLVGHLLRFTVSGNASSSSDVHAQVLFNTFKAPVSGSPGSYDSLSAFKATVHNKRQENFSGTSDQTYEFYKYPRPITVRPVVWRTSDVGAGPEDFLGTTDNSNKLMVFFGSGKYDAFYDSFDEYMRDPDHSDCESWPYGVGCKRDLQAMFAVIDYQNTGNSGLVSWDDMLPNHVSDDYKGTDVNGDPIRVRNIIHDKSETASYKGWYTVFNSIDIDNRGEKVITKPVIWEQENHKTRKKNVQKDSEWIAFFTTFTPNMQGTCDIRNIADPVTGKMEKLGGGYLMSVSAETGGDPKFVIQDIDSDSMLDDADASGDTGYAGHKFHGSILSRVDVDPYQGVIYVKTGTDAPVKRIQIAGKPPFRGASTSYYRIIK